VLASLDQSQGMMKTTNLGDSGYLILRPRSNDEGKAVLDKVFRSKEQQRRFNHPYQCGTNCDPPLDAYDTQHQMKKSDIVVMGSDGLFDNVFDEDMQPCLLKELKTKNGAIELESP